MATCRVDDCENDAVAHGYCDGHVRRFYKGQVVSTPLAQANRSPMDVLRDAAIGYADADSEDDAAATRADDRLRKAGDSLGRHSARARVREGMEKARAAGKRLGRPPLITPETARKTVEAAGSVAAAAKLLRVSRWAIWRALRRAHRGAFYDEVRSSKPPPRSA